MLQEIDPIFFQTNRQNLKKVIPKNSLVIFVANSRLQKQNDEAYEFHQDSNFWYLTGLDVPEAWLILDQENEWLILPNTNPNLENFETSLSLDQISHLSGISKSDILSQSQGFKRLKTILKDIKQIGYAKRNSGYSLDYSFWINPAQNLLNQFIKDNCRLKTTFNVDYYLKKLRTIKSPLEISQIKQAIAITQKALQRIDGHFSSYQYEYQIAADIDYLFLSSGSQRAFDSIVASGANAVTVHYKNNNHSLNHRDLLVVDIGAEYNHYAADISRTFSLSKPTNRQLEIYHAVKEVHDQALHILRPGLKYKDLEQQVFDWLFEALVGLKILSKKDRSLVKKYYPHAVSHYLGLDVHDLGDYDQELASGMVITIEPGLYIENLAIGVRIEDDVLITDNSYQLLSDYPIKLG